MSKFKLIEAPPPRNENQEYQIGDGPFGTFGRTRRKKGHSKPEPRTWPCGSDKEHAPYRADMRTFRSFAAKWKGAPAWSYSGGIYTPVTVNQAAWKAFAAGLLYYYTPFKKRKITGYKAYQAWNNAALSAQFLRITYSGDWNPKHPAVQWPDPPATYSPILFTDIAVNKDPGFNPTYFNCDPQVGQLEHDVLLYTSGRPHPGWPNKKAPLFYTWTYEEDALDPPPYIYDDAGFFFINWYCYGDGIITVGMQIVDRATGSPSPIVTTNMLMET
jgi:hypothetical protein